MSNLFVIGYPDAATAEEARDTILDLQRAEAIRLQDAAVAENREGRIRISQIRGAAAGGASGALIGLLFFAPLVAAAIGEPAAEAAVNDDLVREVGRQLTPGSAVLFAVAEPADRDQIIEELEPLGGKLIQAALSAEEDASIREAIEQVQAIPA